MRYNYWYYDPRYNSYPKPKKEYMTRNDRLPFNFFNLGDKAPNFTLEGIVNSQPTNVSLSDYLGKWVVLFFYGSDFTFV